ncbi:NAD-dependent epimerase/dehydratase family protein [bacterium]|nr:NAD-dependent epimerase/dehydratase family protein [bacterium]
MHILVLGGTRYIGAHCVKALCERGHSVSIFNRGKSTAPVDLDLPNLRRIQGERADLAAHAGELRALQADAVLDMRPISEADALAVLDVFDGHVARLVAISSVDVYQAYDVLRGLVEGSDPASGLEPLPLTEESALRSKLYPYRLEEPRAADDPQKLLDDYDKILVERAYLGAREMQASILRLPMVYGPGDYQHRLWEYLSRMQEGRPRIAIDSVAALWRSCRAYVGDVAHAVALALEQPGSGGRVYHLAESPAQTEVQWASRIAESLGWSGELLAVPAEYWPQSHRCQGNMRQHWELDTTAIRTKLGYSEQTAPDVAMARTIEWELANPPASAPNLLEAAQEEQMIEQWLASGMAGAGA